MKTVSVFCGATCPPEKQPLYFDMAYTMGALLAKSNFVVAAGAGTGLMDELLRGASEAGGTTIGSVLQIRGREHSKYLNEQFIFDSLSPRQDKLIELGDAYIALPGGVGTAYEIFNILALKRLRELDPHKPLILVGSYFRPLEAMLLDMMREGFLEEPAFGYYTIVASPKEAVVMLCDRLGVEEKELLHA